MKDEDWVDAIEERQRKLKPMMTLVSLLMLICLSLSLAAVMKFSYELGKRKILGETEIKCPTDRVDPSKSHGNAEPQTIAFDLE